MSCDRSVPPSLPPTSPSSPSFVVRCCAEQQPGSNGTGCSFLYPIVPQCPTQPRVNISGIQLYNISMYGGLTLPGVLLCDPTNPCRDTVFDGVVNYGRSVQPSSVVSVLAAAATMSCSQLVPFVRTRVSE